MMLVPRRNSFDLFDDIFDDPFFTRNENKIMKTDIKEHDDKFELMIDLPGFNKDEIKLSVDDGYLTISAKQESNNEEKDKHGKYIRRERHYGECSRSFYVGDEITAEDVKASFKNGILNIEFPKIDKTFQNKTKKYIEIKED